MFDLCQSTYNKNSSMSDTHKELEMRKVSESEWKRVARNYGVRKYPYVPNRPEWSELQAVWPKGYRFLGHNDGVFYFENNNSMTIEIVAVEA